MNVPIFPVSFGAVLGHEAQPVHGLRTEARLQPLDELRHRGTTAAIRQLMELRPQTARMRLPDGTEREIPVNAVRSGDRIIDKPSTKLPLEAPLEVRERRAT